MKKMMTIVILSFLFLACFNSQKEKNYNFIINNILFNKDSYI